MSTSRPIFTILFLLATRLGAQAPVARPLTPDDILATRDVGEIAVSPTGSDVVFTLADADPVSNLIESRLMLLGPDGKGPSLVARDASSIRWSPDGKRIAFIQSGSSIRVFDVDSPFRVGTVCAYDRGNSFVSKAGNYLAWSPDGTKLAFAGTIEPKPAAADPIVVTRLQYKTRTSLSDNRRTHVFIVDAREGATPKQLTVGEFDDHSIDWGGDGSEIVFLSNRGKDPDANLNYDIYAVNLVTGGLRQITKTPGVEFDPAVSPDGSWIAYTATTRAVTTIDSVAEDMHVFVVPFGGGAPRELNHAFDRRSITPEWSPDSGSVLFVAADHGKQLIYRVGVRGGTAQPLFDRPAQATGISVSRDGTIAFGMTDTQMPREVFRLAPGATAPTQVTKLNADYIARLELVKPEVVHFKSFDGTDVEGWLYPALSRHRSDGGTGTDTIRAAGPQANADTPRTKTPMILSIHGGPHGAYGYTFSPQFQLNASRGYATLAINPRGSSGYGQAFADGCVNNWGGGDYKDLMAGVDHILKTHPGIDPDRLGVMGGSYGGFMTNWAITQTPRFKAAVSIASLSDMISFYATSLYQDLVHQEFGGFPWDDDHYTTLWKWSPLAHVKNVTTPTLFIHGEQDNDVHVTQAEEMFTALRRRGVEAALARYPREGHGFREPKHRLDSATRALAWMDRFLMSSGAESNR